MPLTFVVAHLNQQLRQLHPDAPLRHELQLEYLQGQVSARIGKLRVTPVQTRIFTASKARQYASYTHLSIQDQAQQPLTAEALYAQIQSAEDVILLDRFLRSLHALHHVNLFQPLSLDNRLVVDVHLRHLDAVHTGHGKVFEQLLASLGLTPAQIVIRLQLAPEQTSPELAQALQSFVQHGYQLLVIQKQLQPDYLGWLQAQGVQLVGVDLQAIQQQTSVTEVRRWTSQAAAAGLQTLAENVTTPQDLNWILDSGFTLIEGQLLSIGLPENWLPAGRFNPDVLVQAIA